MKRRAYPLGARAAYSLTYRVGCPACGALPGHYCVNRNGERSRYAHSLRGRPAESAMPDLRAWWRSMKPYEGMYAKPRPADLVVP
jgi:hypothetical protein